MRDGVVSLRDGTESLPVEVVILPEDLKVFRDGVSSGSGEAKGSSFPSSSTEVIPRFFNHTEEREEVDIREELDAMPEQIIAMKNDSINKDIAAFISQYLRDNRRLRKWEEHHNRIETVLTERAKGVFRWVECQFIALICCPQSEDLLDQLLESLPDTLDKTYERMLENIPRTSQSYARQMLILLCGAKRPLSVAELIDGIAVEIGESPRFNAKRRLKNTDAVQQVCPGFTELDVDPITQEHTIRIAHFSVQEYLESERICQHKGAALFSVKKQDANTQIACVCLTILLEPGLQSLKDRQDIQGRYPLASYAAENWPDHFRDSNRNVYLEDQAVQLFRGSAFDLWITIYNVDGHYGERPERESPIYYASLLGLDSTLHTLLSENYLGYLRLSSSALHDLLDAEAGQFGTALQAASARGHEKIAQLLLEKGADINAEGGAYGTALLAASVGGHEKIAQLLLEKGADIMIRDAATASAEATRRRPFFFMRSYPRILTMKFEYRPRC